MKKPKYSSDKFIKKYNHDQRKKEQELQNEFTEKKYDSAGMIISIDGHEMARYVGNEKWKSIDEK